MQWLDASCLLWVLRRPDQKLRTEDLTVTQGQRVPKHNIWASTLEIRLSSYSFHRTQVGHVGVSEHCDLRYRAQESLKNMYTLEFTHTLRAFMFFKSIPTSAVTPSPNLKLDAATLYHATIVNSVVRLSHLKGVFFLHYVHWCCECSQLVESLHVTTVRVGRRMTTTMTRTSRMLRCID